jgi:hypothetical protein
MASGANIRAASQAALFVVTDSRRRRTPQMSHGLHDDASFIFAENDGFGP